MPAIDTAVEAVARAAVDDPQARLIDWSETPLGGGLSGEIGISGGVLLLALALALALFLFLFLFLILPQSHLLRFL